MADVTNVFKATVKALKSRNKALSEINNEEVSTQAATKRERSDFEVKAKELVCFEFYYKESLNSN